MRIIGYKGYDDCDEPHVITIKMEVCKLIQATLMKHNNTVAESNTFFFFVDLRSQQYLWFNVYYFHYMFRPRSVAIFW
jgi:hypothetical protein